MAGVAVVALFALPSAADPILRVDYLDIGSSRTENLDPTIGSSRRRAYLFPELQFLNGAVLDSPYNFEDDDLHNGTWGGSRRRSISVTGDGNQVEVALDSSIRSSNTEWETLQVDNYTAVNFELQETTEVFLDFTAFIAADTGLDSIGDSTSEIKIGLFDRFLGFFPFNTPSYLFTLNAPDSTTSTGAVSVSESFLLDAGQYSFVLETRIYKFDQQNSDSNNFGGSNDLSVDLTVTVPEPGLMSMLVPGIMCVLKRRR